MSQRQTLTVTCDNCGVQLNFEIFDEASWTMTLYPIEQLERQGWQRLRYEDTSKLRQRDICPVCVKGGVT